MTDFCFKKSIWPQVVRVGCGNKISLFFTSRKVQRLPLFNCVPSYHFFQFKIFTHIDEKNHVMCPHPTICPIYACWRKGSGSHLYCDMEGWGQNIAIFGLFALPVDDSLVSLRRKREGKMKNEKSVAVVVFHLTKSSKGPPFLPPMKFQAHFYALSKRSVQIIISWNV